MPTMPSVLPLTRMPSSSVMRSDRFHPCRITAPYSAARRQAPRISSRVRSALQSVSTSGVLVRAMPRRPSAERSTWSNPTLTVATSRTLSGRARTSAASTGVVLDTSRASGRCRLAASISSAGPSRAGGKGGASNAVPIRSATASGMSCALTRRGRVCPVLMGAFLAPASPGDKAFSAAAFARIIGSCRATRLP